MHSTSSQRETPLGDLVIQSRENIVLASKSVTLSSFLFPSYILFIIARVIRSESVPYCQAILDAIITVSFLVATLSGSFHDHIFIFFAFALSRAEVSLTSWKAYIVNRSPMSEYLTQKNPLSPQVSHQEFVIRNACLESSQPSILKACHGELSTFLAIHHGLKSAQVILLLPVTRAQFLIIAFLISLGVLHTTEYPVM